MSGANASPLGRSHLEMSGANASPLGRSHLEMSGANASPLGRSHLEMSGANASPTRSASEIARSLREAQARQRAASREGAQLSRNDLATFWRILWMQACGVIWLYRMYRYWKKSSGRFWCTS